MNYAEQLETPQWENRRNEILNRDKYICQSCNNSSYFEDSSFGVFNNSDIYYATIWDYENNKLVFCRNLYNIAKTKSHEKICFYRNIGNKTIIFAVTDIELKFKTKQDISNSWTKNLINLDDSTEFAISKGFNSIIERNSIQSNFLSLNWIYLRNLNIHHEYYQEGKLAWEYPDDALITLCWPCHEKLHQDSDIKILDINGKFISTRKVCSRCHGAGWFPEYDHVEKGICFECRGKRFT